MLYDNQHDRYVVQHDILNFDPVGTKEAVAQNGQWSHIGLRGNFPEDHQQRAMRVIQHGLDVEREINTRMTNGTLNKRFRPNDYVKTADGKRVGKIITIVSGQIFVVMENLNMSNELSGIVTNSVYFEDGRPHPDSDIGASYLVLNPRQIGLYYDRTKILGNDGIYYDKPPILDLTPFQRLYDIAGNLPLPDEELPA